MKTVGENARHFLRLHVKYAADLLGPQATRLASQRIDDPIERAGDVFGRPPPQARGLGPPPDGSQRDAFRKRPLAFGGPGHLAMKFHEGRTLNRANEVDRKAGGERLQRFPERTHGKHKTRAHITSQALLVNLLAHSSTMD
jgi:hypothetical protein